MSIIFKVMKTVSITLSYLVFESIPWLVDPGEKAEMGAVVVLSAI